MELRRDDEGWLRSAADTSDTLIVIERLGSNPNGHLYGMTANAREGTRAKVDAMFTVLAALGRPSLGIGDGENEIGFMLHGAQCRRLAHAADRLWSWQLVHWGSGVYFEPAPS